MDTCELVAKYLDTLAAKYPMTKFVSIIGDKVCSCAGVPSPSPLLTLSLSSPSAFLTTRTRTFPPSSSTGQASCIGRLSVSGAKSA